MRIRASSDGMGTLLREIFTTRHPASIETPQAMFRLPIASRGLRIPLDAMPRMLRSTLPNTQFGLGSRVNLHDVQNCPRFPLAMFRCAGPPESTLFTVQDLQSPECPLSTVHGLQVTRVQTLHCSGSPESTLSTVHGLQSRRRPSSLKVQMRFWCGWWVTSMTSFSWTLRVLSSLPEVVERQ